MSKLSTLLMTSVFLLACNSQQQEGREGHQKAQGSVPAATQVQETCFWQYRAGIEQWC
ncbi:MAG TPA: hypothetical protein VJ552_09105 [Sediminibacterium sp.]|nr:hypothetical protein [Sediminibacterium sp.]